MLTALGLSIAAVGAAIVWSAVTGQSLRAELEAALTGRERPAGSSGGGSFGSGSSGGGSFGGGSYGGGSFAPPTGAGPGSGRL